MTRPKTEVDPDKLLSGDRAALARAITLIESKRADHRAAARRLLEAVMPAAAVGKDWHPTGSLLGLTPSRTGIELSLGGVLGVAVGWVEGIEINFLGLVAGLDLRRPALKLPGWGRIGI